MLLSMTVSFREGGGVVFPIGFPGSGYRLDEWEFERYRASLDQLLRRYWATWGVRRIRLITFVLLALSPMIAAAFNFFLKQGYLDEALRPWLQALLLMPAAPTIANVFVLNYRSFKNFKHRFPSAPSVSRTAYLSRRILGYVVARTIRPVHEAFLVLIFAVSGTWLLRIAPRETFIALYVIAATLLLVALFKSWQLLVYWRFRQRHGRAPIIADIRPLDPPPTSLSA